MCHSRPPRTLDRCSSLLSLVGAVAAPLPQEVSLRVFGALVPDFSCPTGRPIGTDDLLVRWNLPAEIAWGLRPRAAPATSTDASRGNGGALAW